MVHRGRQLQVVWWIGSVALLIAPASLWSRIDPAEFTRAPQSPLDRSTFRGAAHWRLIAAASAHIPRKASVTFRAGSPDDEMSMFMIAVGLLPHADVRPSTYWRQNTGVDRDAEYVIVFHAGAEIEPGSELLAQWPEGVLLRR